MFFVFVFLFLLVFCFSCLLCIGTEKLVLGECLLRWEKSSVTCTECYCLAFCHFHRLSLSHSVINVQLFWIWTTARFCCFHRLSLSNNLSLLQIVTFWHSLTFSEYYSWLMWNFFDLQPPQDYVTFKDCHCLKFYHFGKLFDILSLSQNTV